MTALSRTPGDVNLLQASKFQLSFSRIPTVQYFCQIANIPGVSMGGAPFETPFRDMKVPGDKLDYEELKIEFLLDEKLAGWQELYAWLRSMGSPKSFEERAKLSTLENSFVRNANKRSYSDATLIVLNGLNNPVLRVQYYNTFITTLSGIEFDTKVSTDDVLTGKASFYFDYYDFGPV